MSTAKDVCDGNLWGFSGSAVSGTSREELVVRTEKLEPSSFGVRCNSAGEDIVSLLNKLVNFSNYLWMPVKGCEKEISFLVKKLESKQGRGVEV